jgi:tetratricopeptide (TPR) repeat protein
LRRVGQPEVDQVRHLARVFAAHDHAVGSGLSAHAVVAQLSSSAHLLAGRFPRDGVRQHLFSAVAELADVAGGMCFDAGNHPRAQHCFRFAVECATEANDWALRAKALSGLANLAVHRGRPDEALSMSEMALVRADRLTPLVRAVMHTRHARALGLAGGSREIDCRTATRQAEDSYAAAGDGEEPEWIAYYDAAHLERDVGRALLQLAVNGGNHTQAQARLHTAIARFPEEPSRGKTLAIANLAHLTMARDDPQHAATLGGQTLDSLGLIRSDRVFEALRQLRAASRRHPTIPAVRDLNHRISTTLRTSAAG